MNSQLQSYLYQNNILNKHQYGFTKYKSKSHAVFKLVTDLYDNIDKKNITQLLYIDYRKAFDTINHEILIRGDQCSTLKSLSIGVLQGSILGPSLFIMFVNDLFNVINTEVCEMIMYADIL